MQALRAAHQREIIERVDPSDLVFIDESGCHRYWLFGVALAIIGVSAQTFTTTATSTAQLTTGPVMRGRVMTILLAIALVGTPVGAPTVGWVADRFGPRWALGVGAAAGFAARLSESAI